MPTEIKKRRFDYKLPESVAAVEGVSDAVEAILEQHTTFVEGGFEGFIAPDQLQQQIQEGFSTLTANEAVKKEKTKLRNALITKHLPTTLVEGAEKDLISAANISDEDTEEQIEQKLNDAFTKRPYLKAEFEGSTIKRIGTKEKPAAKKFKWSTIKRKQK